MLQLTIWKRLYACFLICLSAATMHAQTQTPALGAKLREGKHAFSLQWLTKDAKGFGTAIVKKVGDNQFTIKGEQRQKTGTPDAQKNFITIEGTLKQLTPTELLFVGNITYRVNVNNNGQPCSKSGQQIFKATATTNNKLWRLQDKSNCGGGLIVDNIDLYY
jgi:hypothetical protein